MVTARTSEGHAVVCSDATSESAVSSAALCVVSLRMGAFAKQPWTESKLCCTMTRVRRSLASEESDDPVKETEVMDSSSIISGPFKGSGASSVCSEATSPGKLMYAPEEMGRSSPAGADEIWPNWGQWRRKCG